MKGPFRLAVPAAAHMAEHNGGSIINVGTAGSLMASVRELPYACANAGLNALTVGLADAYAPKVRVNAILPGPFVTDLSRGWTRRIRTMPRSSRWDASAAPRRWARWRFTSRRTPPASPPVRSSASTAASPVRSEIPTAGRGMPLAGEMVGAERIVELSGASNFRDIGGYPVVGGGRTLQGLVFRSDAPHRLTPDDIVTVGRLGLHVVYDLRTDEERCRAPSMLPADVRRVALSIGGSGDRTRELGELLMAGRWAEVPDDYLVTVYEEMLEHHATTFGRLLTHLAEPGGMPALIHCTHGKDRTGVAAALLLSALGVEETTVLDDYELSALYFTPQRMARLRPRLVAAGIDDTRYRTVFGAPRHAMTTALTLLRTRHGSIERFLTEQAAVPADVLRELRSRLTTTQPDRGPDGPAAAVVTDASSASGGGAVGPGHADH